MLLDIHNKQEHGFGGGHEILSLFSVHFLNIIWLEYALQLDI